MDITFKGSWGYHPLLISLANTKEVVAIVNRSGSVHSACDAAKYLDTAICTCIAGGFKREIVRQRGNEHLELEYEDVAEFSYRPVACHRDHRMVVIRKNISKEKGELRLLDEIRYFFYINNDDASVTAEEIVFGANDRCEIEEASADYGVPYVPRCLRARPLLDC